MFLLQIHVTASVKIWINFHSKLFATYLVCKRLFLGVLKPRSSWNCRRPLDNKKKIHLRTSLLITSVPTLFASLYFYCDKRSKKNSSVCLVINQAGYLTHSNRVPAGCVNAGNHHQFYQKLCKTQSYTCLNQ